MRHCISQKVPCSCFSLQRNLVFRKGDTSLAWFVIGVWDEIVVPWMFITTACRARDHDPRRS
ncbi:uncharacterized protein BDV14DRAFT_168514 [Aspergillus stella-maris]|uniref:uncharacterized protein n=1 Tax=Aspergillus stella-maris TaxID=1810926 RepID=UPI003CCCB25D